MLINVGKMVKNDVCHLMSTVAASQPTSLEKSLANLVGMFMASRTHSNTIMGQLILVTPESLHLTL